jgi:peptidoglycan/xylan/chitin deacetylase (PgdA/CDA1 family)
MNKIIFLTLILKFVKTAPTLGKCGDGMGICEEGYCCSQYNWCGKSEGHCGLGCQSVFGNCNVGDFVSSTSDPSEPTGSIKLSTDGRCSDIDGSCINNECCSQYGWCGVSVDHCRQCNPLFSGPFGCGKSLVTTSSSPTNTPVVKLSTNGRCSEIDGSCIGGQSCSEHGWCGTSSAHLTNCNPLFSGPSGCGKSPIDNSIIYTPSQSCSVDTECGQGYCCGKDNMCGSTKDYCPNSKYAIGNTGIDIVKSCINRNTIAITIDDGPLIVGRIIDLLNQLDVKATFFLNGVNFNDQNIIDVKRAYDTGHQIASHSWSHKDFSTLSYTETVDEILRNDNYIGKVLGVTPRYFRFPYLSYNVQALQTVGSLGKIPVDINIDSFDWRENNPVNEMNIISSFFNNSQDTSFIQLSHEKPETSIEFLTNNIDFWKSNGYTFVTIEQCTGAGSSYI